MNKNVLLIIIGATLIIAMIAGCELGINPLVFDGSVTSKTFVIDVSGTFFQDTASIDLNTLRNLSSDEIDSIHFYNLTILIDSVDTNVTPTNTQVLGILSVDNQSLAELDNVPISLFLTERSIFDTSGVGSIYFYYQTGVTHLVNAFKNNQTVLAKIIASSSSRLKFHLHLKVYGQVFTKPKK